MAEVRLEAIARECRVQILRMLDPRGLRTSRRLALGDRHPRHALLRAPAARSQRPDWPDRDRVVLSKGHAVPALYAVLAKAGYFPGGAAHHAAQARLAAPGSSRSDRAAGHRGRHRLARPGPLDRGRHGPRAQAGRLGRPRLLHPGRRRDPGGPGLGGGDVGAEARAARPRRSTTSPSSSTTTRSSSTTS